MKFKRDFFISYTKSDLKWAAWVASVLEEAGYSTYIQAWDFLPGNNFVLEMHNAIMNSNQTIMILSDDYLGSLYCQSEWASAFNLDPSGKKKNLIPIRISEMKPQGLLSSIVYIDLFNVDVTLAKERLLAGVRESTRTKSDFPNDISPKPSFPMVFPLLEMFGVKTVEELPIVQNWEKHSNVSGLFEIPIGCDERRNVLFQRIGTTGDGNHGFVIGASGSGKSEYLKTLILSSAIMYSPKVLSFYYIDFKREIFPSSMKSLPNIVKFYNEKQYHEFLFDFEKCIMQRKACLELLNVRDIESFNKIPNITPFDYIIVIIDDVSSLIYANEALFKQTVSYSALARAVGFRILFVSQTSSFLKSVSPLVNYSIWFNYDRSIEGIDDAWLLHKPDLHIPYGTGIALYSSSRSGCQRLIKVALAENDISQRESVFSRTVSRISSVYKDFYQ